MRRADAGLGLVPPVLGVGAPAVERRAVQRKYPLLAASPCHRCLRAELLAVRYSANEARCSGERLEPCAFMMPLVSASTMKSGDIACSEFAGGRARRRIVVADRTGLLEHRLLRALRRWCKLHRRGAGRRHHDRPGKNEDAPEPCVAARYHWLKNSPRARLAAPANVTGIPRMSCRMAVLIANRSPRRRLLARRRRWWTARNGLRSTTRGTRSSRDKASFSIAWNKSCGRCHRSEGWLYPSSSG